MEGVRFNILCTVNKANEKHPLDVYRFFRDQCGADFIQFIPIVERENASTLCEVNDYAKLKNMPACHTIFTGVLASHNRAYAKLHISLLVRGLALAL